MKFCLWQTVAFHTIKTLQCLHFRQTFVLIHSLFIHQPSFFPHCPSEVVQEASPVQDVEAGEAKGEDDPSHGVDFADTDRTRAMHAPHGLVLGVSLQTVEKHGEAAVAAAPAAGQAAMDTVHRVAGDVGGREGVARGLVGVAGGTRVVVQVVTDEWLFSILLL